MTRALSLAAVLAAGLTFPVLAADAPASSATDTSSVATYTAQLSEAANAAQVRQLLQAQGYTNVSELTRDSEGRWTGTGVKDGKTISVAVVLPARNASGTN